MVTVVPLAANILTEASELINPEKNPVVPVREGFCIFVITRVKIESKRSV